MANEITANFTLRVTLNGINYINETYAKSFNLSAAAPNVSRYTMIARPAATAPQGDPMDLGAVASNGVAWWQNMDAANAVDVGVRDGGGTFIPLQRYLPGEAWPVRVCPGATPYVRSITANVVFKQPIIDA